MKKVVIIHHNDADGRMAGYVMYRHYSKDKGIADALIGMIETDYGLDISFNEIGNETEVTIVDFSLNNRQMAELLNKDPKSIIWLDHHRTAFNIYEDYKQLEKFDELEKKLDKVIIENISGCEIAYLYTNGYELSYDKESKEYTVYNPKKNEKNVYIDPSVLALENVPSGVVIIGDRDCWRNRIVCSDTFALALRSHWDICTLNPMEKAGINFWDKIYHLTSDSLMKYHDEGTAIQQYLKVSNLQIVDKYAEQVEFKKFPELKAVAVNTTTHSSMVFNSVFKEYEVGIIFTYSLKRDCMTFSIYRLGLNPEKTIDCGAIARSFGGGGHPGAAGFSTSGTLPFKTVKMR